MRGMILAAGRGARMGALTATIPKALLRVGDRYLIEYSLQSLLDIGVQDIVINVCYHGEQIKTALGDGQRYGVNIHYSEEPVALETGGGILQALPLLGTQPFIVLSCDIVSDYPLQNLPVEPKGLAHIVMVDNPDFHPTGDFGLDNGQLLLDAPKKYTFGNIGIYRPELFDDMQPGYFRLGDLMKKKIQQFTGEVYRGFWHNLGEPRQLIALDQEWARS
jgi:N-acetyl-alpha-D-muramate 1-phosphate uridylyltransferase